MATEHPSTDTAQPGCPSDLLDRFRDGDHAAFAELVRLHQPYAYALAMRFVWDHAEAEDIVQDSFIRVWNHCSSFSTEMKFTTWLYSIVSHMAMDRIRRKKRWSLLLVRGASEEAEPGGQSTMDAALHNAQAIERVRSLTERLPHVQRLVFTLRDLQDLPVDEVARISGMTPASIKANLCHARKRIRHLLRAYGIREGR
jgi:RNA polymerase sigma-70 factor (ECF subfamily)